MENSGEEEAIEPNRNARCHMCGKGLAGVPEHVDMWELSLDVNHA